MSLHPHLPSEAGKADLDWCQVLDEMRMTRPSHYGLNYWAILVYRLFEFGDRLHWALGCDSKNSNQLSQEHQDQVLLQDENRTGLSGKLTYQY